jgi:PAS domain S-box-containing protein
MDLLQKVKHELTDDDGLDKKILFNKSIEIFPSILDNIPTPVTYITPDHHYYYVNKAYADWYNVKQEDVIGKSVKEFLGAEVYNIIKPYMDRAFKGEQVQYEAEIMLRIGKRFIDATYTPDFDEQGNVKGYTALIRDVTEKKRQEKNLKESWSHYEQLINGLPAAIYTTDKDGYLTMYNQAAVELWGRQPEIGKDRWNGAFKIFGPDGVTELSFHEIPIATVIKEGRKVIVNEPMIIERPDGTRRYFLPHPEPIFDDEGNMTGASNMLIDVTAIKLAEEQQAKLAAIVQSTDDAIISKNLDGFITSWNASAERLYGYKAEEIIGQHITKLIPEGRLSEQGEIITRIRNSVSVDHYETKRQTKDGKLIDVSLTVSPIKDQNGKIIGASKIARDITAQKLLLEELRENEERLRMAIETTKLGTWEFYPMTKDLSCSKECKKILGIPEDFEPDNQYAYDHTYPQDRELVKEQIKKAIDPGGIGSCEIEYRIIRNDDEIRWVKVQGKTFFNNENKPARFIGTILDITDEKLREQELKDSIELFQTMADNVPAMIWMSGDDKFEDYFNKTWLNFTGRKLEEEVDEGWLEGVHPDDMQKCIDTYNESFNQQKGFYSEYRLRRYDGEWRWISDNSVPRFSPDGEFLGFISACMDIDDQKRYREKIQDSELLFKTISNASPAALWMTDVDEQNVFVSDTWLKWTGKTFEEVIDRGWVQSLVEEDREKTITKFIESFRKRKYFHADFRFLRKDGEVRWGLTEGYPFYDTNGIFAGYAGSVTDITDIKKLEQRKDDFIKMASHELKTPITSINGYVQLLMNIYNEVDDKKLQLSKLTVKSSLNTISKQVTKLTRLISELLDLSRIETGKLELNKTEFDLGDLVEEIVGDVRLTTSKHAIVVNNDFSGKIYGDKDRIAQVLMNLLTNAIKYSPDASQVDVNVDMENKNAVVQVKDHGIGIDKKFHKKIFERFYRVEGKSEQTYPGFGIGLFIASEIVQRHHGTISVESEKGKGSVFTVTLPSTEKQKHE